MLIQVITGTTRQGRFSERVANWVMDQLGGRDDFEAELLDLRDHILPFFEGMSPARTGRDYPRDDVRVIGEIIDRSDGFIVLTAEYNHGYPAVLKNAMDWTFVEWRRKPISFVGWGSVGGARAVEQLKMIPVAGPLVSCSSIPAVKRSRTLLLPASRNPIRVESGTCAIGTNSSRVPTPSAGSGSSRQPSSTPAARSLRSQHQCRIHFRRSSSRNDRQQVGRDQCDRHDDNDGDGRER